MQDLHLKKAREIAELVNNGKISAVEVVEYFLKNAKEVNEKVNAFNSITEELAIQQAKAVDEKIKAGEKLPLAGVPIGIKDNLNVVGTKTTCSSKMLENFTSPYESTVTEKLWAAGAICLGKTNLDEFAMGSSTEYSAFGPSKNPYDTNKVPGGSSGGSAVAVSARMVPVSLGSDTGGSIRQPASLCGVVGFKPTYGVVSRFGLVAFASSLDQIGPFATDVEDAELVMSIISGHDDRDSTSLSEEHCITNFENDSIDYSSITIGLLKELDNLADQTEPKVKEAYDKQIEKLKSLGVKFKEISMPLATEHALDCYYIIAPAEASSNLSRYDGARYGLRDQKADNLLDMYCQTRAKGFGEEVQRRIIIGTYALSAGYYDAYYKKAQQVRRLITEEYEKAFADVDFILTPTSPMTAFPMNSKMDDPLSMYLCDILTIPANLAGLPGVSINAGYDDNNMPIGLQLLGPVLSDKKLLSFASKFEKEINELKLPSLIS